MNFQGLHKGHDLFGLPAPPGILSPFVGVGDGNRTRTFALQREVVTVQLHPLDTADKGVLLRQKGAGMHPDHTYDYLPCYPVTLLRFGLSSTLLIKDGCF